MNSLSKARNDLLEALEDLESNIKDVSVEELHNHLAEIRKKVDELFEQANIEETEQRRKMRQLSEEISYLKAEVDEIKGELAVAQLMSLWESHVPRFVIGGHSKLYAYDDRYAQMMKRMTHNTEEEDRWKKILKVLNVDWTDDHRRLMNSVRVRRNRTAHPPCLDLDKVSKSLITEEIPEDERKRIEGLINMLKLTASLLKFGKLVNYFQSKNICLTKLSISTRSAEDTIKMMAEWGRDVNELKGGLQCITYEEAKRQLRHYVPGKTQRERCCAILDEIKCFFEIPFTMLAWEFETRVLDLVCGDPNIASVQMMIESMEEGSREWNAWRKITKKKRWTPNHSDALIEMEQLNLKSDRESAVLDPETAKCLVPDFLKKSLWESALDIIDWFQKLPAVPAKTRKRKHVHHQHAAVTTSSRKMKTSKHRKEL